MPIGMDNSTDPAFRYIRLEEVEAEYGLIAKLSAKQALSALEDLGQTHWLPTDETNDVKKALAARAGILGDYDKLENLGIEHLYSPV